MKLDEAAFESHIASRLVDRGGYAAWKLEYRVVWDWCVRRLSSSHGRAMRG